MQTHPKCLSRTYPTQRFGRELCTKFYRCKVKVLNHMKKGKFPSGLRSVSKVLFLILRLSFNFPRDKTNQIYKPDLVSSPTRSGAQNWKVTRHQCEISPLVPQTSVRGETSGGVTKCRLFSQVKTILTKNVATVRLMQAVCWLSLIPFQ